jgi:hypothetical protein
MKIILKDHIIFEISKNEEVIQSNMKRLLKDHNFFPFKNLLNFLAIPLSFGQHLQYLSPPSQHRGGHHILQSIIHGNEKYLI